MGPRWFVCFALEKLPVVLGVTCTLQRKNNSGGKFRDSAIGHFLFKYKQIPRFRGLIFFFKKYFYLLLVPVSLRVNPLCFF